MWWDEETAVVVQMESVKGSVASGTTQPSPLRAKIFIRIQLSATQ
jgi:hypothetical protein